MYCFICLFHQNMGVLYLTNFTQKFRNILEMNDFGKFVENLHKMTNFEKSPKSPQIDHYFFVRIFKKKKNNSFTLRLRLRLRSARRPQGGVWSKTILWIFEFWQKKKRPENLQKV